MNITIHRLFCGYRLYFKNAKVCVDNFHVVKWIGHAFTKVRIRIMRKYDNDTDEYYLLKKFA